MARKKAYTAEQMDKGMQSALAGIHSLIRYKRMLIDQRRIMGQWQADRWIEQHGFNNEMTIILLEGVE